MTYSKSLCGVVLDGKEDMKTLQNGNHNVKPFDCKMPAWADFLKSVCFLVSNVFCSHKRN